MDRPPVWRPAPGPGEPGFHYRESRRALPEKSHPYACSGVLRWNSSMWRPVVWLKGAEHEQLPDSRADPLRVDPCGGSVRSPDRPANEAGTATRAPEHEEDLHQT